MAARSFRENGLLSLKKNNLWIHSAREDKSFKISQEEIDKAKAEFQPAVKVITLEEVVERGLLSGKRKRGGWHGASPGEKASGIKGVVEEC